METVQFVTDVRVTPGVPRIASLAEPSGRPGPLLAAVGLPLLVLLGSAVAWPVGAGVRRLRRRERAARTDFERRARLGAAAFALLSIVSAAALAWVVLRTRAENPFILLFGLPGWSAPLLVLPWALLAGSVAFVAAAVLAWRWGSWTRWERIHFTLAAAASAMLVTAVFTLGFA